VKTVTDIDQAVPPPSWPDARVAFVAEGERDHSDCALRGFAVWVIGTGAITTGLAGSALPLAPVTRGEPSAQPWESSHSNRAREDFERNYPSDPEGAVSGLLAQVARWEGAAAFGVSPVQAAAVLLSHLPGSAYGRQNLLVAALKRSASPCDILRAALTVSHTPSGPDVLQATAGLLEHYAQGAWGALEWLVSSGLPECRYFVRQIAGCDGVPEARRVEALTRLAGNPDPETRWEVAEALDSGLLTDPTPVWQALAAAPEESTRNLAADRLGTFSG
jgi:hypothetical protein